MPNALGHSIFAAITAILLVSLLNTSVEVKIVAGLIAFGFAFLPDIDHPKAVARKMYRKIGLAVLSLIFFALLWTYWHINIFVSFALAVILSAVFVKMSEVIMPKHRGITHQFVFALAISILLYATLALLGVRNNLVYAFSGLVGYSSHILLDRIA